jgi:hypothetical protein
MAAAVGAARDIFRKNCLELLHPKKKYLREGMWILISGGAERKVSECTQRKGKHAR